MLPNSVPTMHSVAYHAGDEGYRYSCACGTNGLYRKNTHRVRRDVAQHLTTCVNVVSTRDLTIHAIAQELAFGEVTTPCGNRYGGLRGAARTADAVTCERCPAVLA